MLISGRGSNLRALLAACADAAYPAEIVSVVSDRVEAPGLTFAQSAGICSTIIPHRGRQAFAAQAELFLGSQRVQLVCLAGFMRVLDPACTRKVKRWRRACGSPVARCISFALRSTPGRSLLKRLCRLIPMTMRQACRLGFLAPSTGFIRSQCD